jgi:microcin C transport system permease protein
VAEVLDYLWHLTLPLIGARAVSLRHDDAAHQELVSSTRSSKQYVVTARAKGLSEHRVLYGHVFRNAMLIVIAGFPGAFISAFFTGSLLIENIFSLDGLGLPRLPIPSSTATTPMVFANALHLLADGAVRRLISDLLYTWIDPRIDFERRDV